MNDVKNYIAGADIAPYRIVAFNADNAIIMASASTNGLIGLSTETASETGARIDVYHNGIHMVQFAENVPAGSLLTANGDGKAIIASETGQRIIALALHNSEVDEIGYVSVLAGVFSAPINDVNNEATPAS